MSREKGAGNQASCKQPESKGKEKQDSPDRQEITHFVMISVLGTDKERKRKAGISGI